MRLYRQTSLIAGLLMAAATGGLQALDTPELNLRGEGDSPPPSARIFLDGAGNLVFADVATTATTLLELRTLASVHSALSGLGADDHPQYLSAERHDAAHDATANAALAIPSDVGGNQTIGAHVADADIHLARGGAERITGPWTFAQPVTVEVEAAETTIAVGVAESGLAAIRWGTAPDGVALAWDATAERLAISAPIAAPGVHLAGVLDGAGTATLENFAAVAGIAPANLLSAAAGASITQPWHFVGGLRAETMTLDDDATLRVRVVNASGGVLARGERVRFVSRGFREMEVDRAGADHASGRGVPGGWVVADAGAGADAEIVALGLADVLTTGTITAGGLLRWNGAQAEPVVGDLVSGVVALESGTGIVRGWIGW